MPDLILKSTGKPEYVPDDALANALASGLYEPPAKGQRVAVEVRPGMIGETNVEDLGAAQAAGAEVESDASFRERERKARLDREHSGVGGKLATLAESALDTATLGGFGVVADAIGGEEYREDRLGRLEANPGTATVGKVGAVIATLPAGGAGTGALAKVARATPLGQVTRIGGKIAKSAEGASKAVKAARLVGGGAFEGGAQGLGVGIEQLNNSDDPLTLERVGSVLGSNVLLGGAIGAGANVAARGAEVALTSAKRAIDRAATGTAAKTADEWADLATLDAKGLRKAREVELEAIETARVPQRQQLADEIAAFRQEVKDSKVWLSTKGAKAWEGVDDALKREVSEVGKVSLEADKAIDRMLRNPKALATRPQRALDALQQQEAALERLVAKREQLVPVFAADKTGERIAALDAAAGALERNKALQQKIGDLVSAPSSARLAAIDDAKDALVTGGAKKGLGEQMAGGAAFSGAAGLVSAVPVVGPLIAPFAGAAAARAVSEKLFGSLANGAAKTAERMSKAVGALLDATKKAAPAAPVLATSVLGSVAFGDKRGKRKDDAADLDTLYRKRSEEIRSQVAVGPDGSTTMRADARAKVADRLSPIAAVNPILADRIETQRAKATAYLASILPRRPELGGIQTGPDRWKPSDFAMRSWARSVAAVEDPAGIIERLAAGTVTPEDAEVMRRVYPEMLADITKQILEQLPTLQKTLPYERRLALSIFTGAPVDPSMRPEVLAVLQGTFAREAGTDGGVHAPTPQPQFGSVKNQEATSSQQREGA